MTPPAASPPSSQRQSPSVFECVSSAWSVIWLALSHFIAAANMSGIPTERTNIDPAGDEAEPGRAEAGDKAEGGHRKVVEGVLEGVALERLVDARHHHEHHQHRCDEHGGEPERGVVAEPARDGGQRAEHETEHRAEEELAGVVEVVVAVTHLGGVDDLREEGGQTRRRRRRRRSRAGSGLRAARLCGVARRARAVRGSSSARCCARLVVRSGPAVRVVDEHRTGAAPMLRGRAG